MDKLRAMQYFNRSAETRSFTAAARSLEVSTPAVSQLVAELERSLGVALLYRSKRGLSLTPAGEQYYEVSSRLAAQLLELESGLRVRGGRLRGTLTVGMRTHLAQYCVVPQLTRFLERFTDIELVLKPVGALKDLDEQGLDIAVLIGWPPERDLVVRHLAQTRFVVCAAPRYWASAGRPQKPEDLRDHHCLFVRNMEGMLLDHWVFERAGERRTVDLTTRIVSYDRAWLDEAACAGAGVVRHADLTLTRYLAAGLLEPVLTDWEALEAPTIYAAYPPRLRNSKLVRAFLDFLLEVFAELEARHAPSAVAGLRKPKPNWWGRPQARQSASVARGPKASS